MYRHVASLLFLALLPIRAPCPSETQATPVGKPPAEADRVRALPEEDKQWLMEFVAPIILPDEKKIFLELSEPYQREAFKLDFWSRREKPDLALPLGPGYRARYEELWRLAEERYDGSRSDAGRMLLRWGEPTEIVQPVCGGEEVFNGLELWTYNNGSFGSSRKFIFYRRFVNGPYWLWSLQVRDSEVFRQNSCRRSFGELSKDCVPAIGDACAMCEDRCRVYKAYREIGAKQGTALGGMIDQARLFEPAKISTEGLVRQMDRWVTETDPTAKIIHVEGPSSVTPKPTVRPTPSPSTPSGPRRRLSAEEIGQRIGQLEPRDREWLDLARPLLSEEELSLFLQLSPKEKDQFIRMFWKSRS